jgi:hypothetical protein
MANTKAFWWDHLNSQHNFPSSINGKKFTCPGRHSWKIHTRLQSAFGTLLGASRWPSRTNYRVLIFGLKETTARAPRFLGYPILLGRFGRCRMRSSDMVSPH